MKIKNNLLMCSLLLCVFTHHQALSLGSSMSKTDWVDCVLGWQALLAYELEANNIQKTVENTWPKINECESPEVPKDSMDLINDMFASPPPLPLEVCFSQSVKPAGNAFCRSYRNLKDILQKKSGCDLPTERLEVALIRMGQMEHSYKDNLAQMSDKWHGLFKKYLGKYGEEKKNFYLLVADEAWAYASAIDQAIENNCESNSLQKL